MFEQKAKELSDKNTDLELAEAEINEKLFQIASLSLEKRIIKEKSSRLDHRVTGLRVIVLSPVVTASQLASITK